MPHPLKTGATVQKITHLVANRDDPALLLPLPPRIEDDVAPMPLPIPDKAPPRLELLAAAPLPLLNREPLLEPPLPKRPPAGATKNTSKMINTRASVFVNAWPDMPQRDDPTTTRTPDVTQLY